VIRNFLGLSLFDGSSVNGDVGLEVETDKILVVNDKLYNMNSTELLKYEVNEGVSEFHAMLHVSDVSKSFYGQLEEIISSYLHLMEEERRFSPVFIRIFLSDAANQSEFFQSAFSEYQKCAISIVEQPPLDGSKIAMWVYAVTDVTVQTFSDGLYEVKHGDYNHLWGAYSFNKENGSEEQTRRLLTDYVAQLQKRGCHLADNCVRTWFFVQNVDVNYVGVVKARNEVFLPEGLTKETHFIASTGIAGRHAEPSVSVLMDTYAISGLQDGQMNYLYAPTHLNPTHEYGVSFERGTYVDYGDRRHVFISGTASINNKGEVVHVGDISKQTERMLENIEMLLKEADCSFENVAHLIVYLRDVADYAIVRKIFAERFPSIPTVIVLAPVCRPGWLIETECMAVKRITNKCYPDF
jgi:enamine deaminase RidA (YjgF/YER057c/UK114 family)